MANIEHRTLGNNDTKMHGIVKKSVANAAALAALTISADDIAQKIVIRQLDTDQLWVPVSVAPTFKLLDSIGTGTDALLARVSNAIVAATLGTGLSFAGGTLSLSEVSNTAQGVLPAITAANAVPLSNGGGTAAVWTALSGGGSPVGTTRTINTTSPLTGGGDLSANRTFAVNTVSNTTSGVVVQVPGTVGLALISSATAAAWGTDFGANNLTTTGSLLVGSTVASAGSLRLSNTGDIRIRNSGNTADIVVFAGSSALLQFGQSTGTVPTMELRASTVTAFGGTQQVFQTSSANLKFSVANVTFDNVVVAPMWNQLVMTTAGTAQPMQLAAQGNSASTGTNVGGNLTIMAGSATGATATHTGGDLLKQAGDATGGSGTRTGGNIYQRPGTGATANGNQAHNTTSTAVNFQAMQFGTFWGNSSAAPTGNPISGTFDYVTAGASIRRGSGGTITTYAAA